MAQYNVTLLISYAPKAKNKFIKKEVLLEWRNQSNSLLVELCCDLSWQNYFGHKG